jgi:hypothetical protein
MISDFLFLTPHPAFRMGLLPWQHKTPVFTSKERADNGKDEGSKDEAGE